MTPTEKATLERMLQKRLDASTISISKSSPTVDKPAAYDALTRFEAAVTQAIDGDDFDKALNLLNDANRWQ